MNLFRSLFSTTAGIPNTMAAQEVRNKIAEHPICRLKTNYTTEPLDSPITNCTSDLFQEHMSSLHKRQEIAQEP